MESGDMAWMLISTALVVFMVPGLALFYGGMDRSKNVLNMLNMNMYCIGIVPLLWVTFSWTLGNSSDGDGFWGGDFIGNWDQFGLDAHRGCDFVGHVDFHTDQIAVAVAEAPGLVVGLDADHDFAAFHDLVPDVVGADVIIRRCDAADCEHGKATCCGQ